MEIYKLADDALCRFGSREIFNRILYGGHAGDTGTGRFFTFAGDTPLFMGAASDYQKDTWCYQAKNGVLFSGLALTPGHVESMVRDTFSQWFHKSGDVTARWNHGWMDYELTQFSHYFPDVRVKIAVFPLNPDDGFLVCYDIVTDQRVIWCAGFGGITPFFGRFEYHHSARREFSKKDSENNHAETGNGFGVVSGPGDVTMLIGDNFGAEYTVDSADALCEPFPALFLTSHGHDPHIVKLKRILQAGERMRGSLVVLRNSTHERLHELLNDPELAARLRGAIRRKFTSVSFRSPDRRIDYSVPDTLIALDASFHGSTFYHGAIGYHAPFLGWRGWYAPALAGWYSRVRTAIHSHFDTILRSDLPEKVWYDGADRPDLDHEGTQYHHLVNTHGRLPALLHKDDIYDMQEVALDMTLYYFDVSGDLETASAVYDRILELLDWQKRILDPDDDGLYQNFLNTWISDGHSYNGAGCAQASCYNLRACLRTAALGRKLGRDVNPLLRQAEKIRSAIRHELWLEKNGVLAESRDTIGNRLVHPSPELSTLYLAVECDALEPGQALRSLLWARRNIRKITTRGPRKGTLYYSSQWLPRKYSTFGLFPAENAALALAFFKTGLTGDAFGILQGLADVFELSPYPGSITHVTASSGASDNGDIDFTDVSSCYLRLLFEGLWGVTFRALDNAMEIAPKLPDTWNDASLALPSIQLSLSRETLCDTLRIHTGRSEFKTILLPLRFARVEQLFLNGEPVDFRVVPGIGRGSVKVETSLSGMIELKIFYADEPLPVLTENRFFCRPGDKIRIRLENGVCSSVELPEPLRLLSDGAVSIPSDAAAGSCDILIHSGPSILIASVVIESVSAEKSAPEPGIMNALDLSSVFNCALTEVHKRKFLSPRPRGYSIGLRINGRYAWEWNHYGHNALRVEDTLLRQAHGIFTLPSGVPLRTPENGNNVAAVSLWDNFPTSLIIPLSGTAKRVHLFCCGSTNAMQSHVVNVRFRLRFRDGSESVLELIPPDNFDDYLIPVFQKSVEAFYISEGTHGLHFIMETDPSKPLAELEVEAVANEIILMLLGITLEQ